MQRAPRKRPHVVSDGPTREQVERERKLLLVIGVLLCHVVHDLYGLDAELKISPDQVRRALAAVKLTMLTEVGFIPNEVTDAS